jgi:hypothetical protein
MKTLQDQLQLLSSTLVTLSKQLEIISTHMNAITFPKVQFDFTEKKVKHQTTDDSVNNMMVASDNPFEAAVPVLETVYDIIRRNRRGASVMDLREKTGFGARQVSNAVYKLSQRGRIKSKGRGVYIKT